MGDSDARTVGAEEWYPLSAWAGLLDVMARSDADGEDRGVCAELWT